MKIDSWLKIAPNDGVDTKVLKHKLTLPNPDYTSRAQMGFSTKVYDVHGKCEKCDKQLHKRYQQRKDIPKQCVYCEASMRYIINETEMEKFDRIYKEVGNELWVPRAIVHNYADHDFVDNTTMGAKEVDFKSRIQLGPNEHTATNQAKFVNEMYESLKGSYGAVGQSAAGSGKTVMCLELLSLLKRPAIIIVHKEFLMNQWAERIMEFYNIDKSDIGFIQQDVCDFQGKKVVIAMVQSLLAREYPYDMYQYFGSLVWDEVHHASSKEFRKAIVMFPAKYRIGLTATPKRKDRMENIFFWHLGDIASVGEQEGLKPEIKFVQTKVQPTNHELRNMYDFKGNQNLNKVIDYLINNEQRNNIIVSLLIKALKANRKILLLSGRLAHLEYLKELTDKEMLKQGLRHTTGYYIGGMTEEQRSISATRQLIFGTMAMAEEALDIKELDSLFLTTPKTSIEQAAGRILRMCEGKKQPVVIDFADPIDICVGMLKKRMRMYQQLGYM